MAGSARDFAGRGTSKNPAKQSPRSGRRPRTLANSSSGERSLPGMRTEQELEQERYEALLTLALAAEPDEDASEHAERVAFTAQALALALGLSEEDAALIYSAAPLHDLGKIAIPGSLLLKAERPSPLEFEQIKTHTTAGAGLLTFSRFPLLRAAREIALTHHEHWDGSGYPAGLQGAEIPLSGR